MKRNQEGRVEGREEGRGVSVGVGVGGIFQWTMNRVRGRGMGYYEEERESEASFYVSWS